MSRSLFSPSWYRVAGLRPRLRSHVEIHRQLFRGKRWYVLQDHAAGRFHRFSPVAHALIGHMDGSRTMQEIWEQAGKQLGDQLPTQDEVIRLLAQLHASDLLHADITPDAGELAERSSKLRRKALLQYVKNPLAVRLPLVDPDRFLTATMSLFRPLFQPIGFVLWLALILSALIAAGLHWSALTENIGDRVLATENVILLLLTYPIIKALHELGHGYAAKRWGGEVHDMGLMFLVFMPLAYVDASSSSAFHSKWQRAAVAGAGIMVEMSLAAGALFLWLMVEPGLVRACAFNVMLIAGVSTLLFNGNPLLRFDGYYVLADLIEVPNLGTRANKTIFYLIQRHLYGVKDLTSPVSVAGERGWLICYGIGSFVYRMFIMTAIVLFVASQFFIVGVIIAIWAAATMFGVPTVKGIWYLFTSPVLRRSRQRAIVATGAIVTAIAAALFVVPVPHGTVVKGTVWVPEKAMIHAGADGFIARILVPPNSLVREGDPLVRLEDPQLEAELRIAEGAFREASAILVAVQFADPVQAAIMNERLVHSKARLARLRERAARLTVVSDIPGRFVLPMAADHDGRFVRKGTLMGFVVDPANSIVKVAVSQDNIDPVRSRLRAVGIRFAGKVWKMVPAQVRRTVPAATHVLSSRMLSTEGGGDIVLDPADPTRTLEKVFELDLSIPVSPAAAMIGGRVFVRFDHGAEPLAWRAYRGFRQLFLREFNV